MSQISFSSKHTSVPNLPSIQLIHSLLKTLLAELKDLSSRLDIMSGCKVQHVGMNITGCNQGGFEIIAFEEEGSGSDRLLTRRGKG
jgi:hypothetical protein